ncbi:MAG: hypothetical protein C0518_11010 [Opitutus sp.]|nr:hypothetical protein [Opitutus sp.]
MRIFRASLLFLGLVCACAPHPTHAHEYRLQAATSWVENLSRTSFEPTAQDAALHSLDAAYVHARQLASNWTVIVGADAGLEYVPDFDALDRTSLGARATLRRKFGLGAFAPVLDASAALTRVEFRENGRSGWRSDASLTLGKRLHETWRVAAFASWESFTARAAPFDTHSRRVGLETTWDATDRWRFSAGGARLRGQVVANAAWSVWGPAINGGFGPVVNDYYNSVPWAVTDTFGPGWVAYRVEATANFWWAEASFSLREQTRVTLRGETVKVVNRIAVRYDSEIWSLGLVHRF